MRSEHVGLASLLILALLLQQQAWGADPGKRQLARTGASAGNDLYAPFLINNVFNYYSNNGDGSYNKFSADNEGFEFPQGGGKHIIFEDGLLWGGFHKGRSEPKVGGSVYRHGLQAGPILTNGTATSVPVAADAANPRYRIYRVRPDIRPEEFLAPDGKTSAGTPFANVEARLNVEELAMINRYESTTAREIYDRYTRDWMEWPADLGAPYEDRNGNGKYDPVLDVPGRPGADQTLWYVANDMSEARVSNLSGSPPIGLEMHRTIWGYRRGGPIGNTIFSSTVLINKSGAAIDSMFLMQWSDPDLGDAGDDYVGCDTLRALGYVYNSQVDATYGAAVPAGGYVLLQGPCIAAAESTAIFRSRLRPGYKNAPLSSFVFMYPLGFDDPIYPVSGAVRWYRLMNATTERAGALFIDPTTNTPTRFCVSGDPLTGTGWIDGMGGIGAGDRRLAMTSGPFRMAPGDTQEIVVATLAGQGSDRLSSVSTLRVAAEMVREGFRQFFRLPQPPPTPAVQVAELDSKVVLHWGDPASVERSEQTTDQGYHFEGYKVYELQGPAFVDPVLLGTFDRVNGIKFIADTVYDVRSGFWVTQLVQEGSDAGVIHTLSIDHSRVSGRRLANGSQYYFAVTAYSHNPLASTLSGTHSLESEPVVVTVTPQSPLPGVRYAGKPGDTLAVTLTTEPGVPASDGSVVVQVVDPTRLTGDGYAVKFTAADSGMYSWYLVNLSRNNTVVAAGQPQELPGASTGVTDGIIVDGLMVKVSGPPMGIKGYGIRGVRRWTWADGAGFGLEHFGNVDSTENGISTSSGTIGNAYEHWYSGGVGPDRMRKVEIRLAAGDSSWSLTATPTDPNVSRGYRYLRSATAAPARPEFANFIVHAAPGYAFQDYNYSVPFAAYDVDATPPRRLAVGHMENNQPDGRVDGKWWPALGATVGGTANVVGTGPREWWFIFDSPYSETPDPALTVDIFAAKVPMMYLGTNTRRTGGNPVAGDKVILYPNRSNGPAHTFSFSAPKNTLGDRALAREDAGRINVFPNPYFAFNPRETSRYAHFVTFNHLPQRAVVRIFTLAGALVRTLVKDDPGQFLQWDLNNDAGYAVASAVYIVHIELPDLGTTKVLKLTVIPEVQVPPYW